MANPLVPHLGKIEIICASPITLDIGLGEVVAPASTLLERSAEFTIQAPVTPWVLNHNFGRYPNVTLLSVGGRQMLAEVLNASLNQILVYFDAPKNGVAICTF